MNTEKYTQVKKFFTSKLTIVLSLGFLVYHSIFNVYTAEKLSSWLIPKFVLGEYHFKWEKFSLLYGIEIRDFELKGSQDFSKDIVIQFEAFKFRYNLPLLLFGKVQVSNLSLIKPKLYLKESKGIWNLSTCFVSSENTKVEQTTKEELTEISTFLPITAFIELFIFQPEIQISQESQASRFQASLPSIYFLLDTHRFRKIPLNLEILKLPQTFILDINSEKKFSLEYETPNLKLQVPLELLLYFKKEKETQTVYSSKFLLSSQEISLQTKSKKPSVFDFHLSYNLNFEDLEDSLRLNEFLIQIRKEKWIELSGKIEKISSKSANFELKAMPSSIDLNLLHEVYSQIPNLPLQEFKGKIFLDELSARGNFNQIQSNLKLVAKDLLYKNANQVYNLPRFLLNSQFTLNLQEEKKSLPTLPYIRELEIQPLDLEFNGSSIFSKASINSKNIFLSLKINNFNLQEFVKLIGGRINANLEMQGKDLSFLNINLSLSNPNFSLNTSGFKTNPSNFQGKLNGNLQLQNDFQIKHIGINFLSLKLFNRNSQEAISLDTGLEIPNLSPFALSLDNLILKLHLRKTLPILQYPLVEKLVPLSEIFTQEVILKSNLSLNFQKGIEIKGNIFPIIPNLFINDFNINLHTILNSDEQGSIEIPKFQVQGFSKTLNTSFSGSLKKPLKGNGFLGGFIPNAKLNFSLKSEEFVSLTPKLVFKGNFGTNLSFENSKVIGNLFSENTNLNLKLENSKKLEFQNIQIQLPIEHDLSLSSNESILTGDKSKFLKTYGQEMPANFSIFRVIGTHPLLENQELEYIKPTGNLAGLRARVDYIRNVFSLNQLKINTLNGFIYGKDILFNLKSGLPQDMEFSAILQVREVDLKELLPPKSSKKINDGKIISDLNLSGQNLLDPIPNLNLYFSIYKIGKDFGKSAINIVMSSNYIQDYIVSSYSVDKIEVELSRGLVYANILFKPGILPTLLTKIENNKITQQRMPLANFLSRAEKEITTTYK